MSLCGSICYCYYVDIAMEKRARVNISYTLELKALSSFTTDRPKVIVPLQCRVCYLISIKIPLFAFCLKFFVCASIS